MVGADLEANDATGIDDNHQNNNAIDCDAVYMTSAGLMSKIAVMPLILEKHRPVLGQEHYGGGDWC